MTRAAIELLGDPRLLIDGHEVQLASRRQWSLLGSLAVRGGAVRSTDRIVEDVWGAHAPAAAHKNVQVLVGRLRALLPDGRRCIVSRGSGYAVDARLVRVDAVDFEEDVAQVASDVDAMHWHEAEQRGEQAWAMWRGRACGWLADEPWAVDIARSLEERRLDLAHHIAVARLAIGRHDLAATELESIVVAHPGRVDLREPYVLALYRSGRQAEALAACRDALTGARQRADEAVVERLRRLESGILNRSAGLDPPEPPRGPSLPKPPSPAHDIVGRTRELRAIGSRIDSGAGIVTVVGTGGTGKTRLAVEVARRSARRFEDVAWIELAPVRSGGGVAASLLEAFGITGGDSDAVHAVAQAINTRRVLVVLDNFEHVVDAAPVVESLHRACPRAVFLVTSRVRLDVDGEATFQLEPLPGVVDGEPLEAISDADSVNLFRARAALVDGLVTGDLDDLRAVASICALVDDLPLGIELAAARTRLLTPTDILTRLRRRPDLLTNRAEGVPERQRSLRHVVEWSYELLDADEQRTLCIVSTFVGGCALEDLLFADPGLEDSRARALLERLVEHSLAVHAVDQLGRDRWILLDTIAAFGRERLAAHGDDAIRAERRFVDRMRSIAQASNTHDTRDPLPMQRLAVEFGNVRAAIDWAIQHEPSLAHDIYGQLDRYFLTRGSIVEGEAIGARVLGSGSSACTNACALILAGRIASVRSQLDVSCERLKSALHVLGDDVASLDGGRAYAALSDTYRMMRDRARSEEMIEQAGVIADKLDDDWLRGMYHAGAAFLHSDFQEAREAVPRFEAGIACFRRARDEFWELSVEANYRMLLVFATTEIVHAEGLDRCAAYMLDNGIWMYADMVRTYQLRALVEVGEFEAACEVADTLVPSARRTGERNLLMFATSVAAYAYSQVDRGSDAIDCGVESLQVAVETGITWFVGYAAYAIGHAAVAAKQFDIAATCLAAIHEDELLDLYATDREIAAALPGLVSQVEEAGLGTSLREAHDELRPRSPLERVERLLAATNARPSRGPSNSE